MRTGAHAWDVGLHHARTNVPGSVLVPSQARAYVMEDVVDALCDVRADRDGLQAAVTRAFRWRADEKCEG